MHSKQKDPNASAHEPDQGWRQVPQYAEWSFFIFDIKNPIRRTLLQMVTHGLFEVFILLCVAVNCVFLALYDPLEDPDSGINGLVNSVDFAFLIVFTIEAVLRMLAYGVWGARNAYLHDPYNCLDLFLVGIGWIAQVFGSQYGGIRVLRVFRPLRIIRTLAGLRILVGSLVASFPMLVDVAFLCFFFLLIYGIVGLQSFSGRFHYQCLTPSGNSTVPIDEDLCSSDPSEGGRECPSGSSCLSVGQNPNYGITNFDNFGWAVLTVFQCVSMEGWTDIMYMTMDAVSAWTWIYYVSLILLASFFSVQLALAVISDTFSRSKEEQEAQENSLRTKEIVEAQTNMCKSFLAAGGASLMAEEATNKMAKTRGFNMTKKASAKRASVSAGDAPDEENGNGMDGDNGLVTQGNRGALLSRLKKGGSISEHELHEPPENPIRFQLFRLVTWKYFEAFMVFVIVLNTAILATEHAGQSSEEQDFQDTANVVLTVVFVIEMILKIVGLGPFLYWNDKMNRFDGLVTIISVTELFLTSTGALTALRAFRLVRLFKLARAWPSLQKLLMQIYRSMSSVLYFTITFFLFIFIYVILGMQLYGGKLLPTDDGSIPRANFNTFLYGFTTVFQVLTGENWNDVMYETIRSTNWGSAFFYVSLIIFGVYVLLSLFVAILIDNFKDEAVDEEDLEIDDKPEDKDAAEQEFFEYVKVSTESSAANDRKISPRSMRKGDKKRHRLVQKIRSKWLPNDPSSGSKLSESESISPLKQSTTGTPSMDSSGVRRRSGSRVGSGSTLSFAASESAFRSKVSTVRISESEPISSSSETPKSGSPNSGEARRGILRNRPRGSSILSTSSQMDNSGMGSSRSLAGSNPSPSSAGSANFVSSSGSSNSLSSSSNALPTLYGNSFCILPPTSSFRVFVAKILFHPAFESCVMVMIAASCASLAMNTPDLDPNSATGQAVFYLDAITTAAFTLEMVVRMITLGVMLHRNSYFRSAWNCLDFFVVAISITSLALNRGMGQSLEQKLLRSLRVLRSIRVLKLFSGMRLVVHALFRAVPGIINVVLLAIIFWTIFSIMGVQFFKGSFGFCNDTTVYDKAECTGPCAADSGCDGESRDWVVPPYNFDNVAYAFLTLWCVATLEGWVTIMYAAIDARGQNIQPQENYQPLWAFYFIIFIIFGSFFIINLVVGVLVEQFQRIKESEFEGVFMTASQKEWIDVQRQIVRESPLVKAVMPATHPRKAVFIVATSPVFDFFMITIICLNVIIMTTQYEGQPEEMTLFIYWSNVAFTVCFVIEAILKIVALSVRMYFRDGWNRLDFIIILTSILGIVLDTGVVATIFRILRVLRVFRIVKKARSLRALLRTLWYSLPNLVNVASILFLLFFMFAVLGVNLFSEVQPNSPRALSRHANFENWPNAMLLLFRMTTGESWSAIMWDCMVEEPDCEPGHCGSSYSPIYFVLFMLCGTFIVVQLFIAVILENFEDTMDRDAQRITPDDLEAFTEAWSKFDPHATKFIEIRDLALLMRTLRTPLGAAGLKRTDLTRRLLTLQIPFHGGFVHFHETLHAMGMFVYELHYAKFLGIPLSLFWSPASSPPDYMYEVSAVRRTSAWNSLTSLMMDSGNSFPFLAYPPDERSSTDLAVTSDVMDPKSTRSASGSVSGPEDPFNTGKTPKTPLSDTNNTMMLLSEQMKRQKELNQLQNLKGFTSREYFATVMVQSFFRAAKAMKELRIMKTSKAQSVAEKKRYMIDSHIRSLINPAHVAIVHQHRKDDAVSPNPHPSLNSNPNPNPLGPGLGLGPSPLRSSVSPAFSATLSSSNPAPPLHAVRLPPLRSTSPTPLSSSTLHLTGTASRISFTDPSSLSPDSRPVNPGRSRPPPGS
eukprot:ANDGO_07082.mRNA.1 Sodium channel protein 60E